ncbi:hypothetical protein B9Z55_027058 [Caenorhabditis nigoni]|uniref:F-box domain-containing protein n=1 Tax=Caenorhabditis nigoni TaxID=1611254 RepID=A0A2G5SIM3_9PELO|nr:hypothetical protein B9Z55_027058 [Caenorhabditis nigoni]
MTSPTLLGMPEDVMFQILSYSSFRSILNLRKTCRGFQDFLELLQPKFQIQTIRISLEYDKTVIVEVSGIPEFSENLEYEASENIFSDLKFILKNQKSIIEEMRLDFPFFEFPYLEESHFLNFLEKFSRILSEKSEKLKVEKLKLIHFQSDDVLKILPFLEPKILEKLILQVQNYEIPFNLDEISKLDQWKNLVELSIDSNFIDSKIRDINIQNFENYTLRVKTVDAEDLYFLKENLIKFKNFRYLDLECEEISDYSNLDVLLGEPYTVYDESSKNWYFESTGIYDQQWLEIMIWDQRIWVSRAYVRRG